MRVLSTILFSLIIGGMFSSCNSTRWVPKSDALYVGSSIKIEDSTLSSKKKKTIKEQTSTLPRPLPNSRIFGIPLKLYFYNMAGDPNKNNFIRKFFRKIGQPPVLLSKVNMEYNTKVLNNYLENTGYFNAQSSADSVVKNRKGKVFYTLTPGALYTVQNIAFETDSSSLGKAINNTKYKTLLHEGAAFNLDTIVAERARIDAVLKEEGYYYFNPELLILDVDSSIGNHKINMYVKVKENTPAMAKKPYIIDTVIIYPNYRLNANRSDTTARNNQQSHKGYFIVDPGKRFKPELFPGVMRFDSGEVYNRTDHNLTLSRLINLDVFKFVKNRFENSTAGTADTGKLNSYYYLTPLPKKSIKGELSGNTKSNNYIGSLVTLTFSNRNTFKGAEHLSIYGNVGSEVQYGGNKNGYNTYKTGGGVVFTIPKFVVPFFNFNTTNAFVPKTKISLSYDLLNRRKLYTLNSFKGELGYIWKPSLKVTQELNPISVNYVKALNVTQLYLDSIKSNPILKHAIDTQFVIGSNYSYTIDPFINNTRGSGFYFNGIADFSGNLAGLLIKKDPISNQKKIFGTSISQYVKMQSDLRYYYEINAKTRLANRVILGVGIPYGNSAQLPYIKQFFIGGNNSIRAFRSRSLGPGTYKDPYADSSNFFPDQSGDMKLELNTELRYQFNKYLEGAIFIDAGNIWLYKKDTLRQGTVFSKDFMSELAGASGIGLRINLTILLLRLDLGMPLKDPRLPAGQRWIIDQIDFGSKSWRQKNLILNLAIGYPF